MKKMIILGILLLFITSCGGPAARSEFWQHDTMYQNWDHLKFSWFGYRNPTAEDRKDTVQQNWWGIEVPYVPAR